MFGTQVSAIWYDETVRYLKILFPFIGFITTLVKARHEDFLV
jgi:hypothetical protein